MASPPSGHILLGYAVRGFSLPLPLTDAYCTELPSQIIV